MQLQIYVQTASAADWNPPVHFAVSPGQLRHKGSFSVRSPGFNSSMSSPELISDHSSLSLKSSLERLRIFNNRRGNEGNGALTGEIRSNRRRTQFAWCAKLNLNAKRRVRWKHRPHAMKNWLCSIANRLQGKLTRMPFHRIEGRSRDSNIEQRHHRERETDAPPCIPYENCCYPIREARSLDPGRNL
jgi:hypothetical protein